MVSACSKDPILSFIFSPRGNSKASKANAGTLVDDELPPHSKVPKATPIGHGANRSQSTSKPQSYLPVPCQLDFSNYGQHLGLFEVQCGQIS